MGDQQFLVFFLGFCIGAIMSIPTFMFLTTPDLVLFKRVAEVGYCTEIQGACIYSDPKIYYIVTGKEDK